MHKATSALDFAFTNMALCVRVDRYSSESPSSSAVALAMLLDLPDEWMLTGNAARSRTYFGIVRHRKAS